MTGDYFKVGPDGNEYAGDHYLADMQLCGNLALLMSAEQLKRECVNAAVLAGAKVLDSMSKSFGPGQGVSVLVMLAESHIAVHTWPERRYAAVDVFMCGQVDGRAVIEHLTQELEAMGKLAIVPRGNMDGGRR